MPKGIFTQTACVLLEQPVSLDQIESTLPDYPIRSHNDGGDSWEFGGPTLVVVYDEASNGMVAVDIVDRPWPDHMGDAENEAMIFGAWAMGQFGPFTYPGGLERSAEQCWSWEPGRTIAERHKAFIRIRSSYAFGTDDDQAIMPQDYAPVPELEFVTSLASSLLALPAALCYFNPNGEILTDREGLLEGLEIGRTHKIPPLDVWSNVRLFNVNEEWSMMDTVGNSQLDIPDAEACFHSESYDFSEIANFLRNISLYVLNNGEVIKDGDTMDGPGDIHWQARRHENGICDPPRRVLRWFPLDDRPVPAEISDADNSA